MDDNVKVLNNAFLDKIEAGGAEKTAASDAATDFTRTRMREEGFLRNILPPIPITNDKLSKLVHTDAPVVVVEKEPGSPGAVSVPFNTQPISRYIRQPRYAVTMQRILTPKFTKDVDELRTYDMDIRQVLSDNAIKDMGAEEDGKFLAACNAAMSGTTAIGQTGRDTTTNETGIALWNSNAGAITRSNLADARKVMPRTASHFTPETALINNVSVLEIEKWQRDQVGGDLAQDMLVDGFSERKFNGLKWIVTIKTDLVAEGTIYFFANPKNLGKFFVLEDTTMYLDRRAYMLEFFAYSFSGAALGNIAGVTRTDFASTFTATNN